MRQIPAAERYDRAKRAYIIYFFKHTRNKIRVFHFQFITFQFILQRRKILWSANALRIKR